MRPPRPDSAKPRGGAPGCRRTAKTRRGVTAPTSHNGAHYAFVHPASRSAKTRPVPRGSHVGASGRIAALEQNGVLFPWRCPAAAAFSVMPATTGRNIAAALISPQAPTPRGRGAGDVPPLRHGPQGPGALVALRQAQGFMVGAHGARALRAKPAPRVRRLCSLQGNPRARFPWPAASSLRCPRRRYGTSRPSSASSVRPSPFPRSCHGGCGAPAAPAPPDELRASLLRLRAGQRRTIAIKTVRTIKTSSMSK